MQQARDPHQLHAQELPGQCWRHRANLFLVSLTGPDPCVCAPEPLVAKPSMEVSLLQVLPSSEVYQSITVAQRETGQVVLPQGWQAWCLLSVVTLSMYAPDKQLRNDVHVVLQVLDADALVS